MISMTVSNGMEGKDYGGAVEKATLAALAQAGIIVERATVANIDGQEIVDTGRLKGSITWAVRDKGSNVSGAARAGDKVSSPSDSYTVHVGTNVEYAPHHEYGTVKMGARPYLRPALQSMKGAIRQDFAKWVKEFMRRG